MHITTWQVFQDSFLIFLLFISIEKMALEQIDKDLQAQNTQVLQFFLNLAKGQEELKALITKERG